jgi:hypothetical protein
LCAKDSNEEGAFEFVERVVKSTKLVGEDYKFGDISKNALSRTLDLFDADGDGEITPADFTTAIESAAQSTGLVDEDYKFGDLSKSVMEKTVKTVTGDKDYKFGQYTTSFLQSGDAALNNLRREALNQLPKQVWEDVLDGLTAPQREAVAISLIQLAAIIVLTFNFASNILTGLTCVRAWSMVTAKTKLSPLASGAQWAKFLHCKASTEIIMAPLNLPIAAVFSLFLVLPYKDFVEKLQTRLPLAKKYPVIHRALALMVACLGLNIITVGIGAGFGAWFVSAWNLKTWRPLLSFSKAFLAS